MDVQERFRVALHASARHDPHSCMTHLKELLQSEPRHAGALHLLAIQYSELRLYERAIDALKQVLAVDPRRDIARLHLGLILIDQLRDVEALDQFRQLESSADDAIRMCAEAMAAAASSNLTHRLAP
jgi:tetratricopeptide (TPR) repeat protein